MLLPKEYLLKDNESVPVDCTEKICKICKRRFGIPNELLFQYKANVCEDQKCQEEQNKLVALAASALMKNTNADEVKSLIQKALGS